MSSVLSLYCGECHEHQNVCMAVVLSAIYHPDEDTMLCKSIEGARLLCSVCGSPFGYSSADACARLEERMRSTRWEKVQNDV